MTDTIAAPPPLASRTHRRMPDLPIGEPVPTAWREDVLTRAKELDSLRAWLLDTTTTDAGDPWWAAIREHLGAVKQAAEGSGGRRREPQEAEDERLASPAREQILQHRNAALPVGTRLRDPLINRQRAKQRQEHKD